MVRPDHICTRTKYVITAHIKLFYLHRSTESEVGPLEKSMKCSFEELSDTGLHGRCFLQFRFTLSLSFVPPTTLLQINYNRIFFKSYNNQTKFKVYIQIPTSLALRTKWEFPRWAPLARTPLPWHLQRVKPAPWCSVHDGPVLIGTGLAPR